MSNTQTNPYLADSGYAFDVLDSLVANGMSAEEAEQMTEFISALAVKPKAIERPFTLTELKEQFPDGTVTAIVGWDFDALVGADIEVLNDAVSEQITGSPVGLMDIAYEFVGEDRDFNGLVCIKVTASLSDYFDEDDVEPEHRYNPAPYCAKCGGPCEMPRD